jgi:hypothetical protein
MHPTQNTNAAMARVAHHRGEEGDFMWVEGEEDKDVVMAEETSYPWGQGEQGVDGRNGGCDKVINPAGALQHRIQDAAITRVVLLDEMAMLSWGLTLVGFPCVRQRQVCEATNVTRFCAHFGAGPIEY